MDGMTHVRPKQSFCADRRPLVIFIAIAEFIFLAYQGLSATSYFLSPSGTHTTAAAFQGLAVTLAIVAVLLLPIGVLMRKPALLVPHLLMQALTLLVVILLFVAAAVCLLMGTSVRLRLSVAGADVALSSTTMTSPLKVSVVSDFVRGALVVVLVLYAVAAGVGIWCWRVVRDCYSLLVAQEAEKHQPLPSVKSAVNGTDF